MALDYTSAGDGMEAAIQDQIERETPLSLQDMAHELAVVYRDYSKEATLPGADLSAGGTLSILEDAFTVLDPAAQVTKLAAGLCLYWASCAAPGVPAHGGTVVLSVVIPGPTVQAAMEAAIRGLITTQAVPAPFRKFYQTTEAVVKTIPCVVTELIPGTPPVPTPFPEFLS